MSGNVIEKMTPVMSKKGNVTRVMTTNNKENGQTVRKYIHKLEDSNGNVQYIPFESAPRPTIIRKPLYEVTDGDGETYQMTKRQAKRAFSGRQVRKALKRLSSEVKQQLKQVRREELESRVPEKGESEEALQEAVQENIKKIQDESGDSMNINYADDVKEDMQGLEANETVVATDPGLNEGEEE